MIWPTTDRTGARYPLVAMDPNIACREPTSTSWVPNCDLTLYAEVYGPGCTSNGPNVLLLCAADQSIARWPATLIDALTDAGASVVSFEHRDSGRSSTVPGNQGYRLGDMVDDALAVLDALGIERVHVFGRSMGGMVGQLLAIDRPERVESLTLMSTTPGPETAGLSPPDEELVEAIALRLFDGVPRDTNARAEWMVEGQRLFCGPAIDFDEQRERALAYHEIGIGHPPESGHGPAVYSTDPWIDRLSGLDLPAVVIHGDNDPVYGLDHAQALASRLGADMCVLEGVGHEFPPELGRVVATEVLRLID